MGLLDDYGSLLRGKPKEMPPGTNAGPFALGGSNFTGQTPVGSSADIPTGGLPALLKQEMTPGPNRITPTMASTEAPRGMDFGLGDTGFGGDVRQALARPPGGGISEPQRRGMVTALTDMDYGLGDPGFGKRQDRLAAGNPMQPPDVSMPQPPGGLLAANVPLPPARPPGLGGMPPTRSAAAVPLPPARPAGLGGASEVASTTAPPMPPVRPPGLGTEASGGLLAGASPAIVPPAPPIATPPIAPPITPPSAPIIPPAPPIGAMAGGAGSLGGAAAGAAGGAMGGLGGLGSALGAIAKGLGGGGKAPPPPQAKAPELPPPRAGAEQAQQEAGARAQAPQILQGLLASGPGNSLDPRKRRGLA